MVRITTRPAMLGGIELPEGCEIVLSPFVAHRDPARFASPEEFRPLRWRELRPSPFEYFPFGAGGHACVGRGLALQLMREVLASLITRHDLVLDGNQSIDWRLHIMFMPANDPVMAVHAPGAAAAGGVLGGPVAELLQFGPMHS
jgi:cytochrome P450